MDIFVNGKLLEVNLESKINDVLAILNIDRHKGIAIAVNNIVVPKTNWINSGLQHGDKITVINATQGG